MNRIDAFNQKWCAKAPCGCYHYAEDGIACPHDIELARQAGEETPDEPTNRPSLFPDKDNVEPTTKVIETEVPSYVQRDKLLGELNRRFVGNFACDHNLGRILWRTPEHISNIVMGEQEVRIAAFIQGWVAAKSHPIG
jgi:hypothetical protein